MKGFLGSALFLLGLVWFCSGGLVWLRFVFIGLGLVLQWWACLVPLSLARFIMASNFVPCRTVLLARLGLPHRKWARPVDLFSSFCKNFEIKSFHI